MAYNSDGYIMFDFSDVDFRRASQTIEGLYDRCVKIIGTNKFILVINANGKTPLPSVCSFINNQYVIESCLYTFAITSNDTILIRRNEPDPSQLINDEITSPLFTWSSSKIDSELDTKADASALADYQPLLTAVSPISISEDDEISVDLSSKQDTLTAGDNISIVDNVISSVGGVRTFNYKGTGSSTFDVTLPFKWHAILSIQGMGSTDNFVVTQHQIINNLTPYIRVGYYNAISSTSAFVGLNYVITETTDYKLVFTASNSGLAFNELDHDYTIIYF